MFQNEQLKKFEFDSSVTPHEEKTLSGHSYGVTSLAVLSDGRLASGSFQEIKLWNVLSGACERTLSGHSSYVRALTLLSDGRLASGSWKEIKLWNVLSGECEGTLSRHSKGVCALTLLSDGRLASGGDDHTIKLWNVKSGACEVTLSSGCVWALTLLLDGRLASGGYGKIKLWNVLSGSCEVTLLGHGNGVKALILLSDGRLASGSTDKTIKLWNVSSGSCEVTLSGHSHYVQALTLLSDGRLASGGGDNTIKLLDVLSGTCESALLGHSSCVNALTILSDGRLASGSSDKTIKLWNVGLTLKMTPPVAAARTLNLQQPSAATPGERLEGSKNDQKDNGLSEEKKAKEAQEELANPETQRKNLRQAWETQVADEIIKAYEALILQAPQESINYRERGAFYIYKAENARSNLQKSRLYESATRDFKMAVDLNEWDDLAAEQYDYVTTQLEQLRLLNSPQKTTASTLSSHSSSTDAPSQENKNTPATTVFNLPSLYISADKVTLGKELGKGGFGTVYAGQYNFQTVAIKRYEGMHLPERVATEVQHEVEVMLKLQHECLVRLLGLVQIDSHPAMLVMEYGAKGSLYHYLLSSQEISWSLRLRIAKELARGLAYLHQEKIIHRDIKSLNVVLNEDYHAKWCDFGLAVLKLHSTTTTKPSSQSAAGTDRWKAPELFTGEASHSVASDIWALGMIYFELASRQVPFLGSEGMQLGVRIGWGNPKGETVPSECLRQAPKFAELMQRCWQDRTARPSAIELVQALETMSVVENKTQATAMSHNDSDVTPSFNPFRK